MKRKLKRSSIIQDKRGRKARKEPIVEKFIRFCASKFGRKVMDREAEYLKKELAGRRRILDVGCGIGAFEERLADLNVTGLDSSEEMLEEARRKSSKTFVHGNAYDLPFPDSSFDAVFFVTTLEFLEDYKKAVEEAARILENKGKIIIMMLNPKSEYFKLHHERRGDYFRGIKHRNFAEIEQFAGRFFEIETAYFLGIRNDEVFDSNDRMSAALYAIKGIKK